MEKNKKNLTNEQKAIKVSIWTLICNFVLAIFKLIAGLVSHSMAMISDSIHSASDVFSTIIVMIGIKISSKGADKNHQYGHERFECVAAMLLAGTLAVTGGILGYNGIKNIVNNNVVEITSYIAIIAGVVSIIVKEIMYWLTIKVAKDINSGALKADAWHHRSDALSSVGSLIGIGGAMLGVGILDSIASIIICLFIFKTAYDIFVDSIKKMTDEACDKKTLEDIENIINCVDGVRHIDLLYSRKVANKIFLDIEISVDGKLLLVEAHDIAEDVHYAIEKCLPDVKHCNVHINPDMDWTHKEDNQFEDMRDIENQKYNARVQRVDSCLKKINRI